MSKTIIIIISYLLSLSIISSQLNDKRINTIKKIIANSQSTDGLYSSSIEKTLQAVKILTQLKEKIPKKKNICKELKNTKKKDLTAAHIELNEILKCEITYQDIKIDIKKLSELRIGKLSSTIKMLHMTQTKVDWEAIKKEVYKYYSNGKFSKISESKYKSIYATAVGIEILGILNKHISDNSQIKDDLKIIFNELQSASQELSNDMITYTENGLSNYRLNYEIIKSISSVKNIIAFPKYKEFLQKILNYYITFHYEAYNIPHIYYLFEVLKRSENLPFITINQKQYNTGKDANLDISFVNGFGEAMKLDNYKLLCEIIHEDSQQKKKFSAYDLDDDSEVEINKKFKKQLNITNKSKVNINIKDQLKKSGKYNVKITLKSNENKLKITKNDYIFAISNIKIKSLKFRIDNTVDTTLKEKEISLDYPNKSFRNFQANQDSVLSLKAIIEKEDNDKQPLEQVYLRLKHMDNGKIYSAYSNKNKKNEYSITFLIDDPANMESYNGQYELALIASSPYVKEPQIWNFGKVTINFRKPMDPNYVDNYKNNIKPKMLPTFTQELKLKSNIVFSSTFCGLIIISFFILLYVIKVVGANTNKFPSESKKAFYSCLFIILLLFFGLLMIMFWIKLNLVQILTIFGLIFLPSIFIIYNSMKSIKIEV